MAYYTTDYMAGRKKYARPQAMIWSDNDGEQISSKLFPSNAEIGSNIAGESEEFIILSDHNRSPIDLTLDRIETRERMINGRMRSYHIADKRRISVSWDMLPSRRFSEDPKFDEDGQTTIANFDPYQDQFTVDGGAGGVDILNWYENHTGSFFVLLSYDSTSYGSLTDYTEVIEMYIADFSYSVQKRGATNYDMWNISVTLEEV
jgi:hypothetical protein